jgi:hypothetical protein
LRYRAFLFGLLLWLACTVSAVGENRALIEETLRRHGVSVEPAGLAAFLQDGWKAAKPPATLPDDPPEKTTLLIDTWTLLALRHEEMTRLPEVQARLATLALRYATADFPPAVLSMLDDDMKTLDPKSAPQTRTLRMEYLQYNGMVALSLFGEASPNTLAAARKIYDAETRPIVRVSYAQTLIMLGDLSPLDDLLAEVAKGNRDSSVAAAQSLSVLLGKPFALNANMAVEPRAEAAKEIVSWWKKEGVEARRKGNLRVSREAVLERAFYQPPARHPVLRTVRDLLRASSDKTDVTDQRGSRTAMSRLRAAGPALLDELSPIVTNPREDLDIRSEAILWYTQLEKPAKVKRQLKKLTKDPNPEIVELARRYLDRKK